MKVKIRDKVYNPEKEPVMLIFKSKEERKQFAKQIEMMEDEATRFCIYPPTKEWTENNYAKIKIWMLETENEA